MQTTSITKRFNELFDKLEHCDEDEQKQKIEEMNEIVDEMDGEELKTVFTTELFDRVDEMIKKKKIDLENAIMLLKRIGYCKVLKGISVDGYGKFFLNRRFEKMIFEEDQKKEGENEKLLSDLCECYMSLSFFFQTEMLHICVP
eukprot:MONOS_15163.1-p1 / transcript=MONOS_15163.1 / gene=MONOS_15163 / organism=Monocercomonoides_exilis_PA203 / gene_product=unspecified product / transcript_product=unspecified product / location=Mono_scaffold01159:13838-14334(+) / protein_length=144 / sequence_SO=supercontig / SO=protein_coding / is_pseudo=false